MSTLHPIEGTITGKPYHSTPTGRLHGPDEPRSGTLRAPVARRGDLDAGSTEPESTAIAELGGLISALGSLSAQAQSLPLSPPTLPGLPQGGYQPRVTDYTLNDAS